MTRIAIRYFDGVSARPRTVWTEPHLSQLVLSDDRGARIAALDLDSLVAVDDGLNHAPTVLTSRADAGVRLVFPSPEALAPLLDALPQRGRQGGVALGVTNRALVQWSAAAIVAGVAIYFAFPVVASALAVLVPQSLERRLGDTLMEGIASDWPECREPAGRAALAELERRLAPAAGDAHPLQMHVVKADIPNAFALPGNRVVLFSGLIAEAGSADEVAGVLAHEIGHQAKRHPIQGLVKSVGAAALMTAVFGGVAPDAVASWGTTLYASRLSREAEQEADVFAVELLASSGVGTSGLKAFFERIRHLDFTDGAPLFTYVSTHPPTPERIAFVEANAAPTIRPALAEDEWQALRAICGDE